MENWAKIDITGAKPTQHHSTKTRRPPNQSQREDAVSAMGGANTGCSNEDEEVNPLEELRHTTPKTNIETTSPST
jgi:hypothetical protein